MADVSRPHFRPYSTFSTKEPIFAVSDFRYPISEWQRSLRHSSRRRLATADITARPASILGEPPRRSYFQEARRHRLRSGYAHHKASNPSPPAWSYDSRNRRFFFFFFPFFFFFFFFPTAGRGAPPFRDARIHRSDVPGHDRDRNQYEPVFWFGCPLTNRC